MSGSLATTGSIFHSICACRGDSTEIREVSEHEFYCDESLKARGRGVVKRIADGSASLRHVCQTLTIPMGCFPCKLALSPDLAYCFVNCRVSSSRQPDEMCFRGY